MRRPSRDTSRPGPDEAPRPRADRGDAPTGLLDRRALPDLARALDLGRDAVVAALGAADRPWSGATAVGLADAVAGVDLDVPLDDLGAALSELREVWLDHAVWFHHPRYQAHLNCPVAVPAVAADVIATAVNTSMDTWDQSGAAALLEQHLLQWVGGRIGFATGAGAAACDGVLTSGGTQSNLHGLLLAREAARRAGTDPRRWCVVVSERAHFSARRAADLLGLCPEGRPGEVLEVTADPQGRMRPDALARVLRGARMRGLVPVAVVATAGTTDHGAVDPLDAVSDVVAEHDALAGATTWLHVDAAYGGGLLVSPTRRHLLAGIERADSVTVDFHKTWFQPVACSALLVRRRSTLVRHHADYLNPAPDHRRTTGPDLVDHSLQTTRRFDALKLWMTLRTLGPDHLGELLDRCCDLAARTRARLAEDPDVDVVPGTDLSTVLFRLVGDGDATADEVNDAARAALVADGAATVARTRIDGRTWLKLTLLDPTTTDADVDEVLDLVRVHAARASHELSSEVAR